MKIYSINTNSHEPVSFEKSYLYNQYDKIQSFLIKNYGIKYKEVLAKPIISDEQVLWHGNFQNKMNRIADYPEDVQNSIKQEYWELINYVNVEINKLTVSNNAEKESWGKLLKEVFNDENNIILTDGNNWCLLWGWRFRNNQENYLPPLFKSNTAENQINSSNSNYTPIPLTQQNPISSSEDNTVSPPIKNKRRAGGFWISFLHGLRYFVYRFWGLLFFIILALLISCLFKHCNSNACNNCNNLDSLNNKIIEMQKKAAARCNQ
jgi:hypothetical protein